MLHPCCGQEAQGKKQLCNYYRTRKSLKGTIIKPLFNPSTRRYCFRKWRSAGELSMWIFRPPLCRARWSCQVKGYLRPIKRVFERESATHKRTRAHATHTCCISLARRAVGTHLTAIPRHFCLPKAQELKRNNVLHSYVNSYRRPKHCKSSLFHIALWPRSRVPGRAKRSLLINTSICESATSTPKVTELAEMCTRHELLQVNRHK